MKSKIGSISLIVAAIALVVGMVGCQSTPAKTVAPANTAVSSNTAAPASSKLIGFIVNDMSISFVAGLATGVQARFAPEGFEVQTANGAMDSTTQINEIENYSAMGANVIIIIPVDPNSIADAITRAQAAGTKVLVLNSDTKVQDALMQTDRHGIGVETAQLAVNWIDKTFPNAADNSIEVAIFEARTNPQDSANSDGLEAIKTMSTKVNVVQIVDGVTSNAIAQTDAAAVLQAHPDVKVIICEGSEPPLGVNAYVTAPGSPVKDLSQFATFGGDFSAELAQDVKNSETNKTVLRGTVKFGADDLIGEIHDLALKMALGQTYPKVTNDPINGIDTTNVDKYLVPAATATP